MAKKASAQEKESVTNIADSINEKYGNIAVDGNFLKENSGRIISTGLLGMDLALHGGIREGTVTHIEALAKSGKTTFALTFAAQAQKEPYNKNVYYIDAEGRLQPELIDCIEGLNKKKLIVVKSSVDKLLTAEDYLSVMENIIKDDPGSVIVLDSIAALAPESELAAEMNEMQRATLPKLMYKFYRKIVQLVPSTKTTLITITHMQANPSGYGSPLRGVGGNAPQYFASYWLSCISVSKADSSEGKKIGQDSKFKVIAAANGSPGDEPILFIRYGKGCDKYLDIIKIAEEMGILAKAGAWYSLQLDGLKDSDGDYPKLQGINNVAEYLKNNPKAYEELDAHIRKIIL